MRKVLVSMVMFITCASFMDAQVISYEIDNSFNSGLTFNRGAVSDLLLNEDESILVMGMFNSFSSPHISSSALITSNGSLIHVANFAGTKVASYKYGYLQYGHSLHRFTVPGGGLYHLFQFEFTKQAYSGPLSNVARDAVVLPDDNILVAGRFFTDSTLMGTSIESQGLRQLCMIDSTGAPVPNFPMLRCEWPTNSEIYRIAKMNTGDYIISGRFQEVEGHTTNHVARLHSDFSVDTTFVSPFAFRNGAVVFIQLIDDEDRIVVTGSNAELTNNPDTYPGLVRLQPTGSIDSSFNIPYIIFVNPNTGIVYPQRPSRVLKDHDGTYLITGQFVNINGTPRKGIAKLTEDGALIEGVFEDFGVDEALWGTWEGSVAAGPVVDVGEGKLLIGGQFSSFGGEPYSCLVRLQPNGFVGTSDRAGRGTLKVFPNPAQQYFRIGLPEGLEPMQQVELCDMQGRTLRSWPATQGPYAVDGLPAGMYVVRARGREGVYTQKLILEP